MAETIEIEVWWIPQAPMDPFVYPVATLDAGRVLCDALGKYDLFQFENNIKPDYSNMGGVRWRVMGDDDDSWTDVDGDNDDAFQMAADEIESVLASRSALSLARGGKT